MARAKKTDKATGLGKGLELAFDLGMELDQSTDVQADVETPVNEIADQAPIVDNTKEAVRLGRHISDMTLAMSRALVKEVGADELIAGVAKAQADNPDLNELEAVRLWFEGYSNAKQQALWAQAKAEKEAKKAQELADAEAQQADKDPEPVVEDQPVADSGKLERANKLTIQTEAGILMARFYRTHKLIKVLDEADLEFSADDMADEGMTKLEIREVFRKQVIAKAQSFGVEYDTVNRGQVAKKFTDMEAIREHAEQQVQEILNGLEWGMMEVSCDGFDELMNYNGKEVTSTYANGTIAYAGGILSILVDNRDGISGHIEIETMVVSGQFKKPRKFFCNGNEFNLSNAGLLKALTPAKEEPKTE